MSTIQDEPASYERDPEVYKHPANRAQERLIKALDAYLELRAKLGGHRSPEGKELAAAYKNLKANSAGIPYV